MQLLFPVNKEAPITQTFEEHKRNAPKLNPGLDWGVPLGTPVRAAGAGHVVWCGLDKTGYGNMVKVEHANGDLTLYAHLSTICVQAGQPVRAGEKIGESGSTGNSTGPHLHFEYRVFNKCVDPLPFLGLQAQPAPVPPARAKTGTGRVLVDALNVRSGPGVTFPVVGQVHKGEVVDLYGQAVSWVEIGPGRFVAAVWDGEKYLE